MSRFLKQAVLVLLTVLVVAGPMFAIAGCKKENSSQEQRTRSNSTSMSEDVNRLSDDES